METNELPDELANIRYINAYTAPAGYFEGLADDVISKVNLPLATNTPLSVPPANYFDNLADTILFKIKSSVPQSEVQKELEELEPFLASISRTNVYQVPQRYFDSFGVSVPAKKEETPVVKMRRPAAWITYTAAAVIMGIIAVSAVFFIKERGNDGDSEKYSEVLAKVSDNDLSDYLNNTVSDADFAVPQYDDKMNNSEGLYQILLNNVTDSEIQDYFNQNDNGDEKNIKGI